MSHSRVLQKYGETINKWKAFNTRNSLKLNRRENETAFARAESYRRQKEVLDILESQKTPEEA